MGNKLKNERGSVMGWLITIIMLLVVGAGIYLGLIRFEVIEAPEFLANQPWMATFLPPSDEEEGEAETPEISIEDNLRFQLVDMKAKRDAAEARVTALEQELADAQALVQEREDEIARLRNQLELGADRNIANVGLILESMAPEEASVILSNFEPDRAAMILGAMRENKAAEVLEVMDEAVATAITEIMAGFHNLPAGGGPMGPSGTSGTTGTSGTGTESTDDNAGD